MAAFFSSRPSVQHLAERVRRGDSSAVVQLGIALHAEGMRFLKGRRLPPQDARELVQDYVTLISAKLFQADGDIQNVQAYFKKCLHHELIKRSQAEKKHMPIPDETEVSHFKYFSQDPAAERWEEAETLKLNQKRLDQAIAQLSEKCQQVVRSYYMHEWSMAEIAEEMGYSNANTVKTRKKQCITRLKELFFQQRDRQPNL